MPKSSSFHIITSIPPHVPRASILSFLHSHRSMIELNPLVIDYHQIPPPRRRSSSTTSLESTNSSDALPPPPSDGSEPEIWYSVTDTVPYMIPNKVTYKSSFRLFPTGMSTTSHAPLGLVVQSTWRIEEDIAGEMYLREDVELKCSAVMNLFVKKTIKKAHGDLVHKLIERAAEQYEQSKPQQRYMQPQMQMPHGMVNQPYH